MLKRWIWLLTIIGNVPALADFTVACPSGCVSNPADDRTPNLLVIQDGAETFTLEWSTRTSIADEYPYVLIAGNPTEQDVLAAVERSLASTPPAEHPFGDGRAGYRIAQLLAEVDPHERGLIRKRCVY